MKRRSSALSVAYPRRAEGRSRIRLIQAARSHVLLRACMRRRYLTSAITGLVLALVAGSKLAACSAIDPNPPDPHGLPEPTMEPLTTDAAADAPEETP
jgi:hypothetical protein